MNHDFSSCFLDGMQKGEIEKKFEQNTKYSVFNLNSILVRGLVNFVPATARSRWESAIQRHLSLRGKLLHFVYFRETGSVILLL